jgi:hypothetical protein
MHPRIRWKGYYTMESELVYQYWRWQRYLLNDAVNNLGWWYLTGNDPEGSDNGLICGIISVFAWTEENHEKCVRTVCVYDLTFGFDSVKAIRQSKV